MKSDADNQPGDAEKNAAKPPVDGSPTSQREAVENSPPGTAAGKGTTRPDASDEVPSPAHRDTAERARRDAESERENTDLYDTSGQDEDPPKTPYRR